MNVSHRNNERWYSSIAGILVLVTITLSILTSVSLILVSDIVSEKLYEMTVQSVLQNQSKDAKQLSYRIIEMPSAISKFIEIDKSIEQSDIDNIFHRISSVEKEVMSVSIIEFDKSEIPIKQLSSSSRTAKDYLPSDFSGTQLYYDYNAILSIGEPYKDNMGIYTITPIYITYYKNGKKSRIIILEYNLSLLFYNTLYSNVAVNENRIYSIYTNEDVLLETTANYMKIRENTLIKNNSLNLLESEKNALIQKGSFNKNSGNIIELFTYTEMGYILKGEIPTSYITSINRQITSNILTVTVLSFLLLITMSIIAIHLKKTKENSIRMSIETIQAKLDPHFLFNTLNSMVGLLSSGESKKLMVGFKNLSLFLRSSLSTQLYVSLKDELDMLESYFEVQKIRYQDSFECTYSIEKEGLLNCVIPRFTIQPIVENCFVHAVALSSEKVSINIHVTTLKKKDLCISISNSGHCSIDDIERIKNSLKTKTLGKNQGVGLSLINKELKILYGNKYGLRIGKISDDFFEILIYLPQKY